MFFWLLNLSLSALSLTFSKFFVNAKNATFIYFINFRVYRNEYTVAKILMKFFLFEKNFGTGIRVKFGCWNYSPFFVNESIITI